MQKPKHTTRRRTKRFLSPDEIHEIEMAGELSNMDMSNSMFDLHIHCCCSELDEQIGDELKIGTGSNAIYDIRFAGSLN